MPYCVHCGSKLNENYSLCSSCGTIIDDYAIGIIRDSQIVNEIKNAEKISNNSNNRGITEILPLIYKMLWFLCVCFFLDIVGLSLLLEFDDYNPLLSSTKESFIISTIAIIPALIQLLVYQNRFNCGTVLIDKIFYELTPTVHYICLLIASRFFIGNFIIFYEMGNILFWGIFIGSIHMYLRGQKTIPKKTRNPTIYLAQH